MVICEKSRSTVWKWLKFLLALKGELQCENKLIHMIKHSKCWRMTGLGQAAL